MNEELTDNCIKKSSMRSVSAYCRAQHHPESSAAHTLESLLVVKIVWIVLLLRDLFSAWSFTVYWVDGLSSARL